MFQKLSSAITNRLPTELVEQVSLAFGFDDGTPQAVDRTYYCMVPQPQAPTGFTLHTVRHLPVGLAAADACKQERVFLLPSHEALATLRELFNEQTRPTVTETTNPDIVTEFLQRTADQIDEGQMTVTKGLLLVGGVVALFNPITGIGLLASSLVPKIGGDAVTAGIRTMGGRVNEFVRNRSAEKADADAEKEYEAALPTVCTSPLLMRLLAMFAGDEQVDADDARAVLLEVDDRNRNIVVQAIAHIYEPIIKDGAHPITENLSRDHRAWLSKLVDEATAAEQTMMKAGAAIARLRSVKERSTDPIKAALSKLEVRLLREPTLVQGSASTRTFVNNHLTMLDEVTEKGSLTEDAMGVVAAYLKSLANGEPGDADAALRVMAASLN